MAKRCNVFLSHIHEEKGFASALKRFLVEVFTVEQVSVFLSSDSWDLKPGEVWLERIREELKRTHIVALLITPVSVNRLWVSFEAGAAWISDKVILPVCFRGFTIDQLPKPLSDFTAVELYTYDAAYDLVKGVAKYCCGLTPTPPMRLIAGRLKSLVPLFVEENNKKYETLFKTFDLRP